MAIKGQDIHCKVENGGTISNRKGVNIPGVELSIPFMSEKDKEDLLFGIKQDVDFVAAFHKNSRRYQGNESVLKGKRWRRYPYHR